MCVVHAEVFPYEPETLKASRFRVSAAEGQDAGAGVAPANGSSVTSPANGARLARIGVDLQAERLLLHKKPTLFVCFRGLGVMARVDRQARQWH